MLEGHLRSTKQRIENIDDEYILVVQDTSYYNFSGHQAMLGLGKIQGIVGGIIQHNLLVLSGQGCPLGLLAQEYWSRGGSDVWEYRGKESLRWIRGLETVNRELGGQTKRVVLVQDREADIYEFFQAERATQVELLVRVHEPRNLEIVCSGEQSRLDKTAQKLSEIGRMSVRLKRDGQDVELVISLKAARVNVLAGKHNPGPARRTEGLSLVIAEEVEAFDKTGKSVFDPEQRALWYLLTSLEVETFEQIERVVGFYALRWRIERLHYTLKSGALDVEKLQFDDIDTTINALTFYSIVAWQILAIVYLTRQDQDQLANACYEEKQVAVLEAVSQKSLKTVKQATLAMAKLVGFAPSKRQPMPGIKVLAQALERLHYMKLGFDAKPT